MYKKITHTIVEEHFDHPMAAEIKDRMENCSPTPPAMAVNFAQAIKFRLDARTYFSALQTKVRNLITDLVEPKDEATSAVKLTDVVDTINRLGSVAAIYYGTAAGDQLATLLKDFALAAAAHVGILKANGDATAAKAKCAETIAAIAKFLSTANPEFWPATAVTAIFTDYSDALLAQAAALIKKDATAAVDAENTQHDVIMGNTMGKIGLADVFATGIIRQFPDQFSFR